MDEDSSIILKILIVKNEKYYVRGQELPEAVKLSMVEQFSDNSL